MNRTVAELELRRSDTVGIWDTVPATVYWILGAASTLDAPVLNASNGTVNFPIAQGQTFHVFAADPSTSLFVQGATFVLTVRFTDGETATANAVVPPAPTVALSYLGELRDWVRQSGIVIASDGAPDGTFAVTLQAVNGLDRTITRLELRRTNNSAIWDTDSGTPYWLLGAAVGLDGPLLNASNGAVNFAFTEGQTVHVFVSDFNPTPFIAGNAFAVTVRFADRTTSTATVALGP